jgi:peptidoglycan/LPS O-acetylase OafA/YrhL
MVSINLAGASTELEGATAAVTTTPPSEGTATRGLTPPRDPYATFLQNRTFGSLNGVRCLCCLAVIKEHVGLRLPPARLVEFGWLGVDMFFVISGFLIVTLLIRERARAGFIDLKKFYIRRSLRIFPVYYLTIFLVVGAYLLISPWKPNGLRFYLATLPVLLTYTLDFLGNQPGVLFQCWSLAMEEQFYQIWPAIEKFAAGWRSWVILGVMLVINQAVNFGFCDRLIVWVYNDPEAIARAVFLITFTPILLGVALAHALNAPRLFRLFYAVVGHRVSPFMILAALTAFCEIPVESLRGWPRLTIQILIVLLLASLVIREDHFARPILMQPFVARLGVISYGMYIFHTIVIAVIFPVFARLGINNRFVLFLIVAVVTYLVAELSFRLFEEPFLRLKARFGH